MEKVKKIEKKISKKLEEVIKEGLVSEKDKILIAFSGGPDSVFLYHFLNLLKNIISIEISIVYINHNLRHDVENDLKFINEFSNSNNVNYYIESVNVKKYATKNKKSIELAARELRYEAIENIRKKIGYNKIATGHNLDDNVETFIFRLLRGTSVTGLKSIPKTRENIVRPILDFEKSEILSFLKNKNYKYIIDYTNNKNDYTRNFIRNKIFPDFENINPTFRQKIDSLIKEINEKENCKLTFSNIYEETINHKDELIQLLKRNNVEISREKINQIYKSLFSENGKLQNEGSKEFYLGKNKVLQNIYGELKIISIVDEKTEKSDKNSKIFDKIKTLKENQSIEWYNYEIILYENIQDFKTYFINKKNTNYTFYKFDDEKIKDGKIIVRSRKDGDRIFLKNLGHKKVKKILIDEKIMKWERDFIPIIEIEDAQVLESLETEISKIEIDNNKKIKEILAISDIKFSKFLEKISNKDIENLENSNKSKLLIIGRKNGRKR
ncbi:tRNA lysidine(34) synthetase TilS [Leptotrichia hongkongensis]|jgi:tRNA(ile)-lysidine synthetase|uniref:tRNA lysidine(34) synthetase TilS n=1 Tax=Leptotrichia hongkongensis TaxID=554406 RepID=UPI0035A8E1D8